MSSGILCLPPAGLYPERPAVWRSGEYDTLISPVVQVCESGLILCCPAGFESDGTSIPEVLPFSKEGPWSTASYVHDGTGCMGVGWYLEGEVLVRRRIPRSLADNAWREGHLTLRHMKPTSSELAWAHWTGLKFGSWRPWSRYRENENKPQHRDAVEALRVRAEQAIVHLLKHGPVAVENVDGYALARVFDDVREFQYSPRHRSGE